jgi:hypothetical protein
MYHVLSRVDKLQAQFASRLKRVRAFLTSYKNYHRGSALILTMFVAPLAYQAIGALSGTEDDSRQPNTNSMQHITQPTTDTGSSKTEKPSVSVRSEEKLRSSTEQTANHDVDVRVNGQKVPVSKNGSVHKRMTSGGNETVVDVHVKDSSRSSGSATSSTTITVDSHSVNDEGNDEGGIW